MISIQEQKDKTYEEVKKLLDVIPIKRKEERAKLKEFMRFIETL